MRGSKKIFGHTDLLFDKLDLVVQKKVGSESLYIYLMIMVSWCIGSCQRCDQKKDVLGSKEVRKYL